SPSTLPCATAIFRPSRSSAWATARRSRRPTSAARTERSPPVCGCWTTDSSGPCGCAAGKAGRVRAQPLGRLRRPGLRNAEALPAPAPAFLKEQLHAFHGGGALVAEARAGARIVQVEDGVDPRVLARVHVRDHPGG